MAVARAVKQCTISSVPFAVSPERTVAFV